MYVPRHFSQGDTALAHEMPLELVEKMCKAVVGFDLPIAELQAKRKINLNLGSADRDGVVDALENLGGESNLAVAATMRSLPRVRLAHSLSAKISCSP